MCRELSLPLLHDALNIAADHVESDVDPAAPPFPADLSRPLSHGHGAQLAQRNQRT